MNVSKQQQKTNVHVFLPMTDAEKEQFEKFIYENSIKKGEWLKRLALGEIAKLQEGK